jgi:uncharacterized coiled-coil protein SlyX
MLAVNIRDWIQVVLSSLTFLAIIIAGIKVIGIAQKGIESHERRILDLEEKQMVNDKLSVTVTTISSTLSIMATEIERMRNRLDRFLDTQAAPREKGY